MNENNNPPASPLPVDNGRLLLRERIATLIPTLCLPLNCKSTDCNNPVGICKSQYEIADSILSLLTPLPTSDKGGLLTSEQIDEIRHNYHIRSIPQGEKPKGWMIEVLQAQLDLTASLKDGAIRRLEEEIEELKKRLNNV